MEHIVFRVAGFSGRLLRDEMPPLLRSVTACHSLCDAVLDKVEGAGAGEGQGAHGV